MARRKVDGWYSQRLYGYAAEGWKSPAIHKLLKVDAREAGRSDFPSARWVYRRRQDFEKLNRSEQQGYELCRWPDSFMSGALPWEASPTTLELLALSDRYRLRRPPIGVARWFWRITQVMPGASVNLRAAVAVTVGSYIEQRRPRREDLEWYLAYRAWLEPNRPDYERATNRDDDPLPKWVARVNVALQGPAGPEAGPIGVWGTGLLLMTAASAPKEEDEERTNG